MEKGMNRREFLKATATTGAVLMGGGIFSVKPQWPRGQ